MSYVQGTVVRLEADFSDPVTDDPVQPPDVVVTVARPSGATTEHRLSAGEVEADPLQPGRYFYRLNTLPEYGTWKYQFEGTGVDAVVVRKEVSVSRRLDA